MLVSGRVSDTHLLPLIFLSEVLILISWTMRASMQHGGLRMWLKQGGEMTGVIKLPILGGIKQYKCMVILRDFPYNNALFGLVI